MAVLTCPHCQHTFTPALTRKASSKGAPVHPGPNASEDQLRAYYKRTAPREDIRFTLAHTQDTPHGRRLWADFGQFLEHVEPTVKDARACQDAWRASRSMMPEPNEVGFWLRVKAIATRLERLTTPEHFAGLKVRATWPPMKESLGPIGDKVYPS